MFKRKGKFRGGGGVLPYISYIVTSPDYPNILGQL